MAAQRMSEDGESGGPRLLVLQGSRAVEQREEDALLGQWLVGDDEAFGELVRRHQGLVLTIVRRYATTPEDARDLVQRAFLRAFETARRTWCGGAATPCRSGAAPRSARSSTSPRTPRRSLSTSP